MLLNKEPASRQAGVANAVALCTTAGILIKIYV